MLFQKLILTIATIILIIVLIVIGVALSKASYEESWPPVVGDCPDYWVDLKGNGEACSNVKKLGTCNTEDSTMNFNEMPFVGENGTCAKYRWATRCKTTWDGITSGVTNPCTTPDTA